MKRHKVMQVAQNKVIQQEQFQSSLLSSFSRKTCTPPGTPPLPPLVLILLTPSHNSGVSKIFSTTSRKTSFTFTSVFADVSKNNEFIRSANFSPSVVDTCLENSYGQRRSTFLNIYIYIYITSSLLYQPCFQPRSSLPNLKRKFLIRCTIVVVPRKTLGWRRRRL